MKAPKAYNYTPRRSKALPVVQDRDLGICILISKERDKRVRKGSKKRIPGSGNWSLFGGGNEEYTRGRKRYQENSKIALERELREELGNDFDLEKIFDLKESKDAVGEILSDTRGRLIGKNASGRIKQRLFAVKFSGDIECKGTDKGELTGMGLYPVGKGRRLEKIRKQLEQNMDEFAIKALRGNLEKMRSGVFQPGNINIVNSTNLKWFEEIVKNKGLISRILGR